MSTTHLLSNCTTVSQPEFPALNSRNFPPSLFVVHCWIGFDWNVCICSIPDRREAVLDPWLPQRRRSLHKTLQRGKRFINVPSIASYLQCNLFTLFFFFTTRLLAPPGDVYRGGCEVLPSGAGIRTGPPPQLGHHLQGSQTWKVWPLWTHSLQK